MFHWIGDFIGLFKISGKSEWPEICSSVSLVLFYIMVCICYTIRNSTLYKLVTDSLLEMEMIEFQFLELRFD